MLEANKPPFRPLKVVHRVALAAFSLLSPLLGAGLCVVTTAGCSGAVAQAPFRLRPDTTHFGSLFGPFDGHVLDQGTGNPISAALIIATWSFESEKGPAVPIASYSQSALTDSDGSYSFGELPSSQKRLALLRRFTLIVYKAGYVGYRSDFRFEDRAPRPDFAQLANKIRLERMPPGESRASHLVFLGGGQPLLRAAQAELIQAALDLAERDKETTLAEVETETPKTPVAEEKDATSGTLAGQLLSFADIDATAKGGRRDYSSEPLEQNLPGDPPPGEYSGVHYRKKGQPETHDAALRVFRTSSGNEAETIWKRLQAQLKAPQLRDSSGNAPAITLPKERAAHPLLPEVPAQAPPLRDGEAKAHSLLPHTPPEPPKNGVLPPLKLSGTLDVYDAKQRTYGVVVYLRQLGLVLELLCGADLCPGEEATHELMSRALLRL